MKLSACIITSMLLANSPIALSNEPVKLLSLDWSSQQVLTRVLGELLMQKNIEIEYVHTDATSQWYKLAHGQGDVQIEVWEGTMATSFLQLIHSGHVQEGATHLAKTREEWWYPEYVEQMCEGLPDWTALKRCPKVFAEGKQRGIYYTGPWEKPDGARIRALGLEFDVVQLKGGDEINQKIRQYIAENRPLLIFNWSPNWVEAKYKGKFVEFPAYDKKCEDNPSWGVNPKFKWDCGNPVGGWLKTAISNRLTDKSQCAADIIRSFSLDNHQIALASMLVDDQNLSLADAASAWLEQNQANINTWLSHKSCQ
ncbi:ABC transporter substrate-binding protein [Vibrio sp. S4M6]|uniref:ABC transporter substrate-binding protein n=1 Tax=Vibrio sinus TaxID=2946865 RepID=UPI00202A169B|nr:ABC transporter substrate-binding protein [Vibrio sinus]MCL9780689.1 ABC transporter substrate-binding protein [Vibrio sinus]